MIGRAFLHICYNDNDYVYSKIYIYNNKIIYIWKIKKYNIYIYEPNKVLHLYGQDLIKDYKIKTKDFNKKNFKIVWMSHQNYIACKK